MLLPQRRKLLHLDCPVSKEGKSDLPPKEATPRADIVPIPFGKLGD